jgi:hypothetical protein
LVHHVPTHKKYHKTCSKNFNKKMYRECMAVFLYYLALKKESLELLTCKIWYEMNNCKRHEKEKSD